MSKSRRPAWLLAAVFAAGCAPSGGPPPAEAPRPTGEPSTAAGALQLLTTLADDSLEGRATGTRGAVRAARIVATAMERIGLTPAGDSGFHQRVPLFTGRRFRNGREFAGPQLAPSFSALDTVPAKDRLPGSNVIGLIEGTDPALKDESIVVGAHYDHIGIRAPINGDSVNNGADDDASGVVAVLEIARQLKNGPPPKRTVVFVAWVGEEVGLLGTRWYLDHPVRPLDRMAANLEIEMIARPDTAAGGSGKAWLTGYERSTMGASLAQAGIPIVADKRLNQNFFARSDNYAFALRGIVAHTISSFNLHTDYHRPSDDAAKADPKHLAGVINAAARAVRLLADGDKPAWKPNGQPTPRQGDP